jgi:hypothetical protein
MVRMEGDRRWRCRRKRSLPGRISIAGRDKVVKGRTNLSATVTRKSVVPQSFKWANNWLLILTVVAMSCHSSSKVNKS